MGNRYKTPERNYDMEKVIVKVGAYKRYEFDDLSEAQEFAVTAVRTEDIDRQYQTSTSATVYWRDIDGLDYSWTVTRYLDEEEEQVISAADEPQETQQQEGVTIPEGYKLVKEYKTERIQLLIRPTTKAALKQMAAAQGTSLNDLINQILDKSIEEGEEQA